MPKSHASVTLKRLTKRIHLQKGGPVAERTAQLLADTRQAIEDGIGDGKR